MYWSSARVVAGHRWDLAIPCARLLVTLSVASQRIFRNSGACLNRPAALARIVDVVSTTEGWHR